VDVSKRLFVGIAFVALLLGGCTSSYSSGSSSASDKKFEAFDMCKQFVKNRLKSPSTAKFRNFFQNDGEVIVTGFGNGPYTVTSSVDSENGFGASLRSTFQCTVTNTDGANWHLDNMVFNDAGALP
jgi:hypothetical protein